LRGDPFGVVSEDDEFDNGEWGGDDDDEKSELLSVFIGGVKRVGSLNEGIVVVDFCLSEDRISLSFSHSFNFAIDSEKCFFIKLLSVLLSLEFEKEKDNELSGV
jgi:hypothetical protein